MDKDKQPKRFAQGDEKRRRDKPVRNRVPGAARRPQPEPEPLDEESLDHVLREAPL